jgi:CRISPR/Cas system-associated exonuclease Cas4 (RecB family)
MATALRSVLDYMLCPRLAYFTHVLECSPDRPLAANVKRRALKYILDRLHSTGELRAPETGTPEDLARTAIATVREEAEVNQADIDKWIEDLALAAATLIRSGEGIDCSRVLVNHTASISLHLPPDPSVALTLSTEIDMMRWYGSGPDSIDLIDWALDGPSEQQLSSFYNFRLLFALACIRSGSVGPTMFRPDIPVKLYVGNPKNLEPYKRNQYAEKNAKFKDGYKKGDPKGPILTEVEYDPNDWKRVLEEITEIVRAYRHEIFYRRPVHWGGCKACEFQGTCRADWLDED